MESIRDNPCTSGGTNTARSGKIAVTTPATARIVFLMNAPLCDSWEAGDKNSICANNSDNMKGMSTTPYTNVTTKKRLVANKSNVRDGR